MNRPNATRTALWIACVLGTTAPGCEEPAAPKKNVATTKPREIVGKTTQDVRNAPEEIAKKAAVPAPPRIVSKDPITLAGNTYVTAVGRISIEKIEAAVKLYQGETGEYPKTYDEFMEKIIRANNISLPQLPYYQEYGYDPATHRLLVIEYPDKKAGN
jgi:hypothetical protein